MTYDINGTGVLCVCLPVPVLRQILRMLYDYPRSWAVPPGSLLPAGLWLLPLSLWGVVSSHTPCTQQPLSIRTPLSVIGWLDGFTHLPAMLHGGGNPVNPHLLQS